jgi:hypothetical protein
MTDWTNTATLALNLSNAFLGLATAALCGVFAWAALSEWIYRLRRH